MSQYLDVIGNICLNFHSFDLSTLIESLRERHKEKNDANDADDNEDNDDGDDGDNDDRSLSHSIGLAQSRCAR